MHWLLLRTDRHYVRQCFISVTDALNLVTVVWQEQLRILQRNLWCR